MKRSSHHTRLLWSARFIGSMNILTFYRSSNFVADFKLPGDCFVCVITEADYIGDCKSFRLSLGWLICKFLVNFQISTLLIVLCIEKRNYLCVGHFRTHSSNLFANYITIFHKIELQMVILMCLI